MKYFIALKSENEIIHYTDQYPTEDIIFKNVGNNYKLVLNASKDYEFVEARIVMDYSFNKKQELFLNGFQSWTDTFEYSIKDKMKDAKKIFKPLNNVFHFDRYGDSHFISYKKHTLHGFDFAYIKDESKPMAISSNNYKNAYLVIRFSFKDNLIILSCDALGKKINKGESFTLFDFDINEDINKMMDKYNEPKKAEKIFGYTSWYNHYQNINEEIVSSCLDSLDSRFNLFQIDDGYETFVGDWLDVDKNKFPNGLKELVDKAHSKNLLAGIWLAPFVAETKSRLFSEHPDYFVKDEEGNPISCGGNWSGFYALDMKQEKVRNYIKECLEYFMNLGFDFFKLDFLYASCIKDKDSLTKAERSRLSYEFLREVLKDKLILGCGAVLSSSYGLFDYMRIGPDVSLKFDDVFYMKFMHRERISTKITLRNTIYRSIFDDKLFKNDPDVFLLRDDNISLSFEQKKALVLINALFGSVLMTSDNIKDYDNKKNELLALAFKLHNEASNKSYKKNKDTIVVNYDLDGAKHEFIYYVKKGTIKELK